MIRLIAPESVFIAIGVLAAAAVGVLHTLYMLLFAEALVVREMWHFIPGKHKENTKQL